jgi:hypothetical protein
VFSLRARIAAEIIECDPARCAVNEFADDGGIAVTSIPQRRQHRAHLLRWDGEQQPTGGLGIGQEQLGDRVDHAGNAPACVKRIRERAPAAFGLGPFPFRTRSATSGSSRHVLRPNPGLDTRGERHFVQVAEEAVTGDVGTPA